MEDNDHESKRTSLPPGGKAIPSDQNKWSSDSSVQNDRPAQLPPTPGQNSNTTTNQIPPNQKAPPFPQGARPKQDKIDEKKKKAMLGRGAKRENIDFISESKQAAYEDAPRGIRFTLAFIIVILSAALIWAMYADIDITVNAMGKVVPSSHIQVVQNLEGGLVSKIYVKEGHIVHKGQTLLELDDTRFRAEYSEKRAKMNVLESEIMRLQAEATGKDKIDYPAEFVKENPEIVRNAETHFERNNKSLEKNLLILKESYDLAKKELDIVTPLTRQGIMSNLEMIRLQREVNSFKGKITEMIEGHRKQAREELNKLKAELNIVKEQITASKDRMNRTEVKSPVDGIVNKVHITSIGEVVTPDEKIIEIVPLDDTLSISINVEPADIGFIKTGQKASVKISAYDFAIYGDVKGIVTRISSDSIKNDKGDEFYTVIIKANKNYIGNPKDNLTILPGMTVTASITTTKRSVLSYFLKPLFKIKEEAFVSR